MDIVTELLSRGVDVNTATNVTLLFLCYFYTYCACVVLCSSVVKFVVLSFSQAC